ncbi:immunity protein Tsi6 family protein [Serratia sp. CY85251]|uniref:immunity protein Tsi6 family protein n=1 Tax=Serratia sp. CY85251 TaxID=3383696 RepID=UPI003F9F1576
MYMDTALDYVDRALRLAKKRLDEVILDKDGVSLVPMYDSILQQLFYLHNVVTGQEKDKSRIHKMTMGMYAGKEFRVDDPIFADRIGSALYIAEQIGGGLKVVLPHEDNPGYWERQQKLRAEYPDDFDV